ncbi:cubilin homolog [Haliotis rubra]|uniref:cubilin homolog n=1 Tax=Haliotis rubra TaxID=36100 RepID=UPI001EE4EEB8|nr:cubilin homolog [Haliotis rubra]
MDFFQCVVCFHTCFVLFRPAWACSENFVADSGTFTSPNYPNGYQNNLRCTFTLTPVTPGAMLRLVFDDFSTEKDRDGVEIYDKNDKLVAGISGGRYRWVVIATMSYYRVVFISDGSIMYPGVSAFWSMAPSSEAFDYQVAMATSCPVHGLFQPIPQKNGIRVLEIMLEMTFHKCMLLCNVLPKCSFFEFYVPTSTCYAYETEASHTYMYPKLFEKVTSP